MLRVGHFGWDHFNNSLAAARPVSVSVAAENFQKEVRPPVTGTTPTHQHLHLISIKKIRRRAVHILHICTSRDLHHQVGAITWRLISSPLRWRTISVLFLFFFHFDKLPTSKAAPIRLTEFCRRRNETGHLSNLCVLIFKKTKTKFDFGPFHFKSPAVRRFNRWLRTQYVDRVACDLRLVSEMFLNFFFKNEKYFKSQLGAVLSCST